MAETENLKFARKIIDSTLKMEEIFSVFRYCT
jgi:hypothetical protein